MIKDVGKCVEQIEHLKYRAADQMGHWVDGVVWGEWVDTPDYPVVGLGICDEAGSPALVILGLTDFLRLSEAYQGEQCLVTDGPC